MRSAGIVEVEVTANRGAGLGDGVVGLQINLLVFDGFPKALDEHIVAPGSLAVHADGDPVFEKNAGEAGAGELAGRIQVPKETPEPFPACSALAALSSRGRSARHRPQGRGN